MFEKMEQTISCLYAFKRGQRPFQRALWRKSDKNGTLADLEPPGRAH
jgi:hypothetical protein